ncbi:hypothetical protein MIMGU_mgv1a017535mg [Erythranthe guttata]|uniref:Uncharacterized protein n=1 Tax=Erythranthe guttata TaxID=4155 RepID=A0A022Q8G5_ERYGU|nr:hypothetical protein MIMGU_mgv1a017535mg [Erythranthe guttata]
MMIRNNLQRRNLINNEPGMKEAHPSQRFRSKQITIKTSKGNCNRLNKRFSSSGILMIVLRYVLLCNNNK